MYSAPLPGMPQTGSSNVEKDGQEEKRVYQAWKGSNIFCFGGRLIFGPDVRSLFLTIFLILAPTILFCAQIGRKLLDMFPVYAGVLILIIPAVLAAYIMVLLILTSGTDPGIIPRNPHPPEPEEGYEINRMTPDSGHSQTHPRLPRTKDLIVNGYAVKVKYCDTCMLYRPPRCSHCSICNNCVERFDHHCPWVGNCIGRRNYRTFFLFVSSTTLLCIYVFSFSWVYISKVMERRDISIWEALKKSPEAIVLIVYTFVCVWFVGGLSVFHLYLVGTNKTTYESFRYRYERGENPYDKGVLHNFKQIFFTSPPPSKNKFRAKLQHDDGLLYDPATAGNNFLSPNMGNGVDLELGGKPSWPSVGTEALAEFEGYNCRLEHKEGYQDNLPESLRRILAAETEEARNGIHPRRSSWGRKSGSWETTPDILALASGVEGNRNSGDITPPGNR
eukprot:TRINITY_DN37950_c0_g1_i1.p1 TRINITY_DN37950_c0_g1~~TRINITY_DN37950_c0_g1_i1.p1  ORF type:complete len:446 (+),score=15.62 TRINITY_DN37950_c0_g1_i1:154-1491(+)